MIVEGNEFRKAFWDWFDKLPVDQRKKFQEYPSDYSELNFYNSIWKHKHPDDTI